MIKKFFLFFSVLSLVVVAGCISIDNHSTKNKSNEEPLSENVKLAWDMYKKDRYQSALVYCDKAISDNPNDKWAWYIKGEVYRQLNESSKAVECYNKSINIDSKFADAYFGMGLTYMDYTVNSGINVHQGTNNYILARKYINKAVELDPNNDIYYYVLSQCYVLDNLNKSIEYIDKAIELNPNVAEYWVEKGDYLVLKHDYNDALQCYNEALKIEPNNVDIMLKKAELYHDMGLDYKEEEILKQVEKINPKKAEFYRLSHNY